MNRNCWTNSVRYGYGGRIADTSVLPVRIIMSPTCSSRLLVGKKIRSAAALTTKQSLLPQGWKPMACPGPSLPITMLCSPRLGGEEEGPHGATCPELRRRGHRLWGWRAPGRERARRELPRRGRQRDVPGEAAIGANVPVGDRGREHRQGGRAQPGGDREGARLSGHPVRPVRPLAAAVRRQRRPARDRRLPR